MIANPEFDIDKHDPSDSRMKFGYYFSVAEPGNGGLLRFHPGGFEKERELTVEFRRWERGFLNRIAGAVGFFGKLAGKPPVLDYEKGIDIIQNNWICSSEKAKKEFGYRQQISLNEGITETVTWYRAQGWL